MKNLSFEKLVRLSDKNSVSIRLCGTDNDIVKVVFRINGIEFSAHVETAEVYAVSLENSKDLEKL